MAEPVSGDIEGPLGDGGVFGESRLFTEESLPREKIEEIRRACLLVMIDFGGQAISIRLVLAFSNLESGRKGE